MDVSIEDQSNLMGLVNCSNVYISHSKIGGYGVFSLKKFKKGEVIETGLMMVLNNVDGNENPHLFTWSNDRTKWACGSGCLPFYNHSDNPNIKKQGNLEKNTMIVYALNDINEHEELLGTYMSAKWRKCFVDQLN